MDERERLPAPELLTEEGSQALRERAGVADLLEANGTLATLVAAMIPGTLAATGMLLGGESIAWALVTGVAVVIVVFALVTGVSKLLGRPVLPDLFNTENDPGELLEGERWGTEAAAAAAARRRNLREGTSGNYWIEVPLRTGVWAIEKRRYRPARQSGDAAVGDWSWFGGDGGGGGGGDGGGG